MIIPALALHLMEVPRILVAREASPPDRFVQALSIGCGRETLHVGGFGHVRPQGRTPTVELNGNELVGKEADDLREDLSQPTSVYRLSGQCGAEGDGIIVRIHVATLADGPIAYRVGRAEFLHGRLSHYTGLNPANAETFWFE